MHRRAPDPWLESQVRTQSRRREGGWALDCSSRTRSYAGESSRTIPQCIASRCGGTVEIGPEPLVSLAPRAGFEPATQRLTADAIGVSLSFMPLRLVAG